MEYDEQGLAPVRDGTRLFWGRRGRGPAVVLNDGLGCDGFAWKYLQPHLAERYRVYHWHYRAHGRSGLPVDPALIDIPAHARDLLDLMERWEVPEATLIGHSVGTQVVLEAYRLRPERIRALILLHGSYGRVTSTFHGSDVLQRVLPRLLEAVERRRGVARALWGRIPARLTFLLARLVKEVDASSIREEDFRPYLEHVALMDPTIFLAMARAAGEHTAEDVLHHVAVPTLVVAAERDTFTPPSLAEHMAEEIPEAELFVLRGASHAAPIEQPVALATRIDRFLRERVDGASSPGTPGEAQYSIRNSC
ncbi:MAG: alpha/beta fold hydrolase [Sandaracinaceae bacterium]